MDDDHEGEEDIERHGNREVWNPDLFSEGTQAWSRGLVDEHDTQRCDSGISEGSYRCRTRVLTQRGEIHQAREDDDPVVHVINNIATVELRG